LVFYNPVFHLLRKVSPRIVHSHFAPEAVKRQELRKIARNRFGCPTVCSFYGHDLRGLIPGRRWPGFDELLKEETAFIVQGPRMADHMVALGCERSRIFVNPLGIDLSLFPQRTTEYTGECLRVLTVARLVEKKGVGDAVRAVALARRAGIEIRLTIAGDGPLRPDIESAIESERAEGFVQLLGTVDYPSLCRLYYSHDVCLQPSVNAADGDTEGGANMCIIEAMAAGLPIVATHHADTATTVAEGEHAYLADEHRPEQLADALVDLAKEADKWRLYSINGRRRAHKFFDAQKQAVELEAIYDRLLDIDPS
jgi:colanic acid/amylovoran biosynthesis glycosyltransferase